MSSRRTLPAVLSDPMPKPPMNAHTYIANKEGQYGNIELVTPITIKLQARMRKRNLASLSKIAPIKKPTYQKLVNESIMTSALYYL